MSLEIDLSIEIAIISADHLTFVLQIDLFEFDLNIYIIYINKDMNLPHIIILVGNFSKHYLTCYIHFFLHNKPFAQCIFQGMKIKKLFESKF